jgi:hypothetical protein
MSRGSITLTYVSLAALILTMAASPLAAQRRGPERQAAQQPTVQVVEARGSVEFQSAGDSRTAGEPLPPRSRAEKAEIFRAALDIESLGLAAVGVPLRLTPSTPYFKDRAALEIEGASMVSVGEKGGSISLVPSQTTKLSNVACYFKPTVVGQPILVEFSVGSPAYSKSPPPAPKIIMTGDGNLKYEQALPPGSQHVSVIVKPQDLQWKTVRLNAGKTGEDYTLFVYACEITGFVQQ